ncbi:MAG TPA: transcriptional repressor LexA [Candidatus Krumholzibacteria bacterium]|nr:transcriptional repressor LexA [Candidatus Krumholzibacteria bacterium]HPD71738.1 transcriptional repressor LexA [Candidatus Krumholzibacteria bacterium]HRY41329.1 transcriptional repressor LexA [Candidatus Krumholzibacteria bacterium]
MSLTRRQAEILDFIRAFSAENHYAPTLQEIGDRFGLSSVATVHKHVSQLVGKGYLKRERRNASRDLAVVTGGRDAAAVLIPLLGTVAAGMPIEALPEAEEIALPEQWLGRRRTFALRVRGDSMIEEQIRDGDVVVVEERETARNGETVIALVDGENATVKQYHRQGALIRLVPANPRLSPLEYDEARVRIQGVVIGVLRRF